MDIDPEDFLEEDVDEVEQEIPITIPTSTKKVNYLNNKDMLKEIHKSKTSYCEFVDQKYSMYDAIVENINDIFLEETQSTARTARAARLSVSAFDVAVAETDTSTKLKLSEFKIDPSTIPVEDLVFRVMTFDHIPLAPGRKKNPKSTNDNHVKLNFHPFKHYVIQNGEPIEVGRSHSKQGKFNQEHGSLTNTLAKMFILMVNRYGQRGNWRNYTYLDEMKGQALLQLSQMALQFNEHKSDNPFSYYTTSISHSFTRIFNLEKKNQDIRDDLLIDQGASPSFSRQLALENEIRFLRQEAQDSATRDVLE